MAVKTLREDNTTLIEEVGAATSLDLKCANITLQEEMRLKLKKMKLL